MDSQRQRASSGNGMPRTVVAPSSLVQIKRSAAASVVSLRKFQHSLSLFSAALAICVSVPEPSTLCLPKILRSSAFSFLKRAHSGAGVEYESAESVRNQQHELEFGNSDESVSSTIVINGTREPCRWQWTDVGELDWTNASACFLLRGCKRRTAKSDSVM
jgi:hypothetical protein